MRWHPLTAAAVRTSPDFKSFEANPGKLCAHPDEFDDPQTAYLPGSGHFGTASRGRICHEVLIFICTCSI